MVKARVEHFLDEASGKYYSDAWLIYDDGSKKLLGATAPIFNTTDEAAAYALDHLRKTFPNEMSGANVKVIRGQSD